MADDVCTCPLCTALDCPELPVAAPPSCDRPASPAGIQTQWPDRSRSVTPVARGPVQDESGALDPLDAQAMAAIEGRA